MSSGPLLVSSGSLDYSSSTMQVGPLMKENWICEQVGAVPAISARGRDRMQMSGRSSEFDPAPEETQSHSRNKMRTPKA